MNNGTLKPTRVHFSVSDQISPHACIASAVRSIIFHREPVGSSRGCVPFFSIFFLSKKRSKIELLALKLRMSACGGVWRTSALQKDRRARAQTVHQCMLCLSKGGGGVQRCICALEHTCSRLLFSANSRTGDCARICVCV